MTIQLHNARLATDGSFILPANFRKKLGLESGTEIIIRLEGEELRIINFNNAVKKTQSLELNDSKNKKY